MKYMKRIISIKKEWGQTLILTVCMQYGEKIQTIKANQKPDNSNPIYHGGHGGTRRETQILYITAQNDGTILHD